MTDAVQMTLGHHRILSKVATSYAWNWRSDYVADLKRWGLIDISHGGAVWSLTDAGRAALNIQQRAGEK